MCAPTAALRPVAHSRCQAASMLCPTGRHGVVPALDTPGVRAINLGALPPHRLPAGAAPKKQKKPKKEKVGSRLAAPQTGPAAPAGQPRFAALPWCWGSGHALMTACAPTHAAASWPQDPNAPKRATTAYFYYQQDHRQVSPAPAPARAGRAPAGVHALDAWVGPLCLWLGRLDMPAPCRAALVMASAGCPPARAARQGGEPRGRHRRHCQAAGRGVEGAHRGAEGSVRGARARRQGAAAPRACKGVPGGGWAVGLSVATRLWATANALLATLRPFAGTIRAGAGSVQSLQGVFGCGGLRARWACSGLCARQLPCILLRLP